MTAHLGGPETEVQLLERQRRYVSEVPDQFKIVDESSGSAAGWVGFWERDWRETPVYEIGWAVLPPFQGRGVASAATRAALGVARDRGGRRYVHAFPSVDNAASNALCRSLGFALLGAHDFEYRGKPMQCNDWRFDLESDV
jgi:RimJ/RimL family protein N-acetyltransferase